MEINCNGFIYLIALTAYTGYRRSIDGVLEAGSFGAPSKSNSNEPHSSDVDVDNHPLTSTATIITQNTSSSQEASPPKSATSSDNFIRNEQQQAQVPPQPAPRTRSLSSQNSVPMTNGDGAKADDAAQVRIAFTRVFSFIFLASGLARLAIGGSIFCEIHFHNGLLD